MGRCVTSEVLQVRKVAVDEFGGHGRDLAVLELGDGALGDAEVIGDLALGQAHGAACCGEGGNPVRHGCAPESEWPFGFPERPR